MAFRVKRHAVIRGKEYNPGDLCDERTARLLGKDVECVPDHLDGQQNAIDKRSIKPAKNISRK
jgi:hypothetical protein